MDTKKSVGVAAGAAAILAPVAPASVPTASLPATPTVQESKTGTGEMVYASHYQELVNGITCSTGVAAICKV